MRTKVYLNNQLAGTIPRPIYLRPREGALVDFLLAPGIVLPGDTLASSIRFMVRLAPLDGGWLWEVVLVAPDSTSPAVLRRVPGFTPEEGRG